ncbi:MAG: TonB-dependent receptor plug domain-containing protein, partial [Bacteroidia bacterium]
MKKYILAVAAMLYALAGYAQTITVVDKTTRESVPGVVIYSNNPKTSVATNAKGQADISVFKEADSVFFRHIVYKEIWFIYKELEAMKSIELGKNNITLSELIISANRWEEEQSEVPNKIAKITIREARFQNVQTSADLLGTSGYAYIQKSQLAGGSPMLRGFATNRVMIVVDGVRMNNAIFRAGNLQNVISIDASSLESTEILFGPGAVMYGSDAIGGVMDFHTLTPKLADSAQKVLFSGNAFGRYSSANTEKTGHLDFNIGLKKFAFLTSFSYSDYDDLTTGRNGNSYFLRSTYQETINGVDTQLVNNNPQKLVHSGFSQMNVMQKIRFNPNKKWDVEYAFHYSETSDAPRYDRLYLDANSDSLLDFAQWYYGPQKWMMNRIGITNSGVTKLYNRLRIVAAMQNYEESRHDRRFNNKRLRNQTETVDAYSLNIDLDKSLSEKITLFYGVEAIYNLVGSEANRVNIETGEKETTNTRYPDG